MLFEIARDELRGVGSASLGEWQEIGDLAVHVRRRLTVKEMIYAGIDRAIDVRGTPEYTRRIDRMRPFLPPQMQELSGDAFP